MSPAVPWPSLSALIKLMLYMKKTDKKGNGSCFEVQSMNSKARCLLTNFSGVSIDVLRNLSVSFEKGPVKITTQKDLNLTSFVYQFQTSISQTKFEDFLRKLPDTIYRIKGYISFDYSDYPYLFQFSYGTPFYMKEFMKPPLNLVFIGEDIKWELIEEQLNSLEE